MYKFDIALSYEGASEKLVQEVADYLLGEGLTVFFSPYYQRELLSGNLKSELFQIYQNESLVKALFVTKEYQQSQYTQIEKRRAVSSTRNDRKRLIVVNFLGEDLPEDLQKYLYLDGRLTTDEIADFMIERVKALKNDAADTVRSLQNGKEPGKNYNHVEHNRGVVFGDSVQIGNLTINQ